MGGIRESARKGPIMSKNEEESSQWSDEEFRKEDFLGGPPSDNE